MTGREVLYADNHGALIYAVLYRIGVFAMRAGLDPLQIDSQIGQQPLASGAKFDGHDGVE